MKQLRWVCGEFTEVQSMFETFLDRSRHMFICWRARKHGTGMKAQASCPNKEFEEGQ